MRWEKVIFLYERNSLQIERVSELAEIHDRVYAHLANELIQSQASNYLYKR